MAANTQAGDPDEIDGRRYRAVKEGLASILAPYRDANAPSKSNVPNPKQQPKNRPHNNDEGDQAVFYNPIQQYNRDLSVLAIRTYGEGVIAEKTLRREKREAKGRAKGQKGKQGNGAHQPHINGAVGSDDNPKKRKADQIEESSVEATAGESKRARFDDQDEVHDLEGQQLGATMPGLNTAPLASEPAVEEESTSKHSMAGIPPQTFKSPSFTILDALSASGLRAIRYAKEIPFASKIIANDLSPEAVKSIDLNIKHNGLAGKVYSNVGDARSYMYSKVGNEVSNPAESYVHRFDVIDLDPYGTAAPFLDSAVQALQDGGLLAVTCTDAGVFASNGYPEKAYALYDGVPIKGFFSHEAGLRLILHAVGTSAAKYGIAIEPLLSLSIDFYARLFIRVHKSPARVKHLAGTTMITYNCDYGCSSWTTQLIARNQVRKDKVGGEVYKHSFAQAPNTTPLCEHCDSKMHLSGPMWAGPLHNSHFVRRLIDNIPGLDTNIYGTTGRLRGMLTLALEEDITSLSTPPSNASEPHTDTTVTTTTPSSSSPIIPSLFPSLIDPAPFFFNPNTLSKTLHCATPPESLLRGAIRAQGYTVTRSHCKPGSFKTDCPFDVLWEIMREWIRQKAPIKEGAVKTGMAGWKILEKMRGTKGKEVRDLVEGLRRGLNDVSGSGSEGGGTEELRRVLESGLYRLQLLEKQGGAAPASDATSAPAPAPPQNTAAPVGVPDATTNINAGTPSPPNGPSHPHQNPDPSSLTITFDPTPTTISTHDSTTSTTNTKPNGKQKNKDPPKLVRWQVNPRANWGPMSRASGH